jgi:hypothetical protein
VDVKDDPLLTSAGAAELTSGMGWSSFVCGTGRSGR